MRVNDNVQVAQVKRVKGNRVMGGCFLLKCVRLCFVFVLVLRNKIVCPRMCSKAPRALTEVWCPWEMSRCLDRDGWMSWPLWDSCRGGVFLVGWPGTLQFFQWAVPWLLLFFQRRPNTAQPSCSNSGVYNMGCFVKSSHKKQLAEHINNVTIKLINIYGAFKCVGCGVLYFRLLEGIMQLV